MTNNNAQFIIDSKNSCENTEKKNILSKNLKNYYNKWEKSKTKYSNRNLAREKLHYYKYRAIENLEKNLIEFETKFTSRGGKVFFANNSNEACEYILKVVKDTVSKKVVKSKTMTCEEIDLENFLKNNNIQTLETDLGEFIVQLANEKPAHITAPIIDKSKEEVCNLLNEKFDQSFDANTKIESLVKFVRNYLREEYEKAGVGITGCNFIIPEIGAVSLTENEANAILSASFPSVHIVVASIDKVIPSIDSLELFQSMLASSGTGQNITAYNHLFFGGKKSKELNGPEQVHVILLDNGRTKLMEKLLMRESLYCIKCGACSNFCPVYKQIGGKSYNTPYNGPIGSVISPFIFGEEEFGHLFYASTLCGKCNEVCPVNINLVSLFVEGKRHLVEKGYKISGKSTFKLLQTQFMKRKRMNIYPAFFKNTALRFALRKTWGQHREIPVFQNKSFNELKQGEK